MKRRWPGALGGQIGIAGAGLVREFEGSVPKHLKRFSTQDCWGLHSPEWRHHWERTGIVDVEAAGHMPACLSIQQMQEHLVDEKLAVRSERARRYLGWPVLLLFEFTP